MWKDPNPVNTPENTKDFDNWRFCLAPMMDWSDRHCRYLWRLMSKHARVYTEMVTTGALLQGNIQRHLRFDSVEHPIALQLGGSDPKALAQCAAIAEEWGYDEVNLNCGCPSDRVQDGKIGAILMAEPNVVADCVAAMSDSCSLPITVKHRVGIDNMDDYPAMLNFVKHLAAAGCVTFIVHARKAWLKGLSPKENREVPPLRYELVKQLKQENPGLKIILNGGITTLEQAQSHLNELDGVMIGREAYQNAYLLAGVDQHIFGVKKESLSRAAVVKAYADYCREQIAQGTRLHHMSRHILGLYQGQPGARRFRRYISTHAHQPNATENILLDALAQS